MALIGTAGALAAATILTISAKALPSPVYGTNIINFANPAETNAATLYSERITATKAVDPIDAKTRGASTMIRFFPSPDTNPLQNINDIRTIMQHFPNAKWYACIDKFALDYTYGTSWTLQNWHDFVANLVSLYPTVRYWEIWNEVLGGIYYNQYLTGYLAQNGALGYYTMLQDAYFTIKSANPANQVIAFGGAPAFNNDAPSISYYNSSAWSSTWAYQTAQQIWNYGAANYCDGIAIHCYGHPSSLLPSSTPVNCNKTLGQCWDGMIKAYSSLCRKPIYFSETGCPANGSPNTPALQGQFLQESFSQLSGYGAKILLWWALTGAGTTGLDFTLYGVDGTAPNQPALDDFTSFAA